MTTKIKITTLINDKTKRKKFLNEWGKYNVVYRFNNIINNRNYVGITTNLPNRLFGNEIEAHISGLSKPNPLSYFHRALLKDLENFVLYIEEYSDDYDYISNMESTIINKYNSCFLGYNSTTSGKIKIPDEVYLTDGFRRISAKVEEIEIASDYGFSLLKENCQPKILINISNGINIIQVDEKLLDEYENLGYHKVITNNTAITSLIKLHKGVSIDIAVPQDLVDEYLSKGYKYGESQLYKYLFSASHGTKGQVIITNLQTKKYFFVNKSEVENYINDPKFALGKPLEKGHSGEISITKNDKQKFIDPEELPNYEKDGWIKGGKKNIDKIRGRVWITDGRVNKLMEPDNLPNLDNNWKLGYTNTYPKNNGAIGINNGVTNLRVSKEDFENKYKLEGYVKGFIIHNKPDKIYFINDGKINKKVYSDTELENYLSKGWLRGFKKGSLKKVWIKKDDEEKSIDPSELSNYLDSGWERGRLSTSTKSLNSKDKNKLS
jgi:hypothetical protein